MLVIGYGNPLRGDDGLGWLVARQLIDTVKKEDVKVLALHQLTPELAEELSLADLAIFIDACCDKEPGLLSCRTLQANPALCRTSSHHLDPPGLLSFTEELYGSSPEAVLFSVGGRSFGFEEKLTLEVADTLPTLLDKIQSLIKKTA